MLQSDLVEAIIAPPIDMFYNTSISTYVWIVSNRKPESRKGKVQLIDTSSFWQKIRKSLGSERELLPHAPDAWIDTDKTKVGYEIPFNRHFYVFKPPRSGSHLLRAEGSDQEQAARVRIGRQHLEERKRGQVRPMQVVEEPRGPAEAPVRRPPARCRIASSAKPAQNGLMPTPAMVRHRIDPLVVLGGSPDPAPNVA